MCCSSCIPCFISCETRKQPAPFSCSYPPLLGSRGRNTMKNVSAVLFDVDGVLLDSLGPHLQICKDKSLEYGLGLSIPSADDFRKMVHEGVKISPMKVFFQAVGFPSAYAERAAEQYNKTFVRDYAIKPFPQVGRMLA